MLKGTAIVSNQKPDLIDDIVEGVRRLFEDLERLLNPEKEQKRAPVPIPVRNDERDQRRDPRR